MKPEAKQCLRKRAGSTLADAMHDGKSKNETWTEHVEMLEDSFRDLEDSGCTLSDESKMGVLTETFQCEPHRHLSANSGKQ